ncbi:hypothetical protein [Thalassospira tepidiphila]|jgi:hypothetical protein|uniref:hypothetical protein n=1 Tax=Thalassospira tepidiphila TaxID=393657 RepID=UPI001BD07F53|nr:hypothetical protein [Thalassospira tepidiphila]
MSAQARSAVGDRTFKCRDIDLLHGASSLPGRTVVRFGDDQTAHLSENYDFPV